MPFYHFQCLSISTQKKGYGEKGEKHNLSNIFINSTSLHFVVITY